MHIRTLKDQANKCYRRFTVRRYSIATVDNSNRTFSKMFTQLGTAVGIVQLRSAMAQGQQYPLRVSDDNVLAFMGSTPRILSSLPPHVKLSDNLVYRLYITSQVGKIDATFQNLSGSGSYPLEQPDSMHLSPFSSIIWLVPRSEKEREEVHDHVFALIVKIHDSLHSRRNDPETQTGARSMNNLTVRLLNLQMFHEALTIAQCAVHLYRTLANANQDVYAPHLAHALFHLSTSYVHTCDHVNAYKAITEAVSLGRRFTGAAPTLQAKFQLSRLICYSAYVGRLNQDSTNALNDAEEAVRGYESLIGNAIFTLKSEEISEKISFLDRNGGTTVMTHGGTRMYEFADALNELHYNLYPTTRKAESVEAGIKALQLYSTLDPELTDGNISELIADLSLSLASKHFRDLISLPQALSYAQQSVRHYEKMFQRTGVIPLGLSVARIDESLLLSGLEKFDEAYAVCQKTQNVLQDYINDQRTQATAYLCIAQNLSISKRYREAAMIGDKVLISYSSSLPHPSLVIAYDCTSYAYAMMGDHSRSVQIAEASLIYCRALALQDAEDAQFTKYVAQSLSELARRLLWAKHYERAFDVGHEAMKLYCNVTAEDPSVLKQYISSLRLNICIAQESRLKLKSLERSRDVVQHCRALVNQFPEQRNLFIGFIQDYANLLKAFDRLADSHAANEEVLGWFEDHPANNPQSASLHMQSLKACAMCLRDQGYFDKESNLYDKAVMIGQPFMDDSFDVARNILWSKIGKSLAFHNMGKIPLALNEIEDCFKIASKYDLEKDLAYTRCLSDAACIYRSSGAVDRALIIIRQSKLHLRDRRSSWIVSDVLEDAGEKNEALQVAQEAKQEMEERMKSPLTTYEKSFHILGQYSLALRLFANNDLSRARDLLVQVRSFFEQHSQTINIWFINFAVILWAQGALECALGQHEEGIAARTKLNNLRARLRIVFPTLADYVEVGLHRERNFLAWRNLLVKYNLTCGHQNEREDSQPLQVPESSVRTGSISAPD